MDGILYLSVSLWRGLIKPHILKTSNIFCQICMKMLPYAYQCWTHGLHWYLLSNTMYAIIKTILNSILCSIHGLSQEVKICNLSKIASATSSKLKNIFWPLYRYILIWSFWGFNDKVHTTHYLQGALGFWWI